MARARPSIDYGVALISIRDPGDCVVELWISLGVKMIKLSKGRETLFLVKAIK